MPNSVYLEGLVAGLRANGHPPENPYDDGSPVAATWQTGYQAGVAMRDLMETRSGNESEAACPTSG